MATKKTTNRREFISTSLKGGLAIGVGLGATAPLLQSFSTADQHTYSGFQTGFDQQPLPYKYDALENVIDAMTMEIHYSKHAAAYAKNVKEAAGAEKVDITKPLEEVLAKISSYSAKMRNNGGGHYNHELFWQCMQPKKEGNTPSGSLQQSITQAFGSFDEFKKQFTDAGKNRFGSGWAWLYVDKDKKLKIGSTPNQDNPLMDISDVKGFPLLGLDVWEHAYYLKYQNKRADYIDNWWNVVNWNYVQQRFDKMS
ncbi:MAG TPA: superoxide dismutase [Ferruginibacter sp.]|nr:superoxide dismutase [Chitinophagaceae bacterium]HRI23908.1 superoxide dismutase [Ferruginibacter sp.]